MDCLGLICGSATIGGVNFASSILFGKIIEKIASQLNFRNNAEFIGIESCRKIYGLTTIYFGIKTLLYYHNKRNDAERFTEAFDRSILYFTIQLIQGLFFGTLFKLEPYYGDLAHILIATSHIALFTLFADQFMHKFS